MEKIGEEAKYSYTFFGITILIIVVLFLIS